MARSESASFKRDLRYTPTNIRIVVIVVVIVVVIIRILFFKDFRIFIFATKANLM